MKAVVNVPVCPLTDTPRSDAQRVDEALLGMTVEVLEPVPDFRYIRTGYRYEGWVPAAALCPDKGWSELPKLTVLRKSFCDVLASPRFQSPILTTLPRGALVTAGEAEDGWQRVILPDGRAGYVQEGILAPRREHPLDLPEGGLRRTLCETAMCYRGTPYRWGGKTPWGIDCSGLTSMAYLLCGIVIYRDAKLMEGFPVREIGRERMKPGDLLYFPGHIAMYLGEGRYCHSTGRAGDGGFAVNSLDPAAPDFRADLAESLTAVGSIF